MTRATRACAPPDLRRPFPHPPAPAGRASAGIGRPPPKC
ncbi:hypothetical protein BURPS1106B_A0320 [Burkholderia pseudomallei 1106b]|uniref:Uncharacterized protein n=1 Tax=Burkholderia pseudomallei (strain 1106a) TaxID=357348 RepID=A3NSM7_BURP0|nr:hypothetical protein BURPS1106A_1068 [Burkholderia pseudomallei 1106a]AFR14944.1 hypothetical protein BPC006_I1058 [Burkholderia pseudomallei BPC006]EES24276.1 hypothetical protein BURPS1106B_A0320 [Burkholderia pseudomallei 1106b]